MLYEIFQRNAPNSCFCNSKTHLLCFSFFISCSNTFYPQPAGHFHTESAILHGRLAWLVVLGARQPFECQLLSNFGLVWPAVDILQVHEVLKYKQYIVDTTW